MPTPIEEWKSEKHGFDVWPDVLRFATENTPMKEIDNPDLERMKWHGFYYRKRDTPGSYMTRIRLPGSELTAEQAKEIAYIAYELGYGIVDVTTRANVQVQGLSIENIPKTAERMKSVGLSAMQTGHDNIRNVFAHPYSGLIPEELIDTRQLCHDITEIFLDSREYSDLPRKFNFCLNGTEDHSAHFWTQDVSYLATRVEDEVLFQMLIGGTQGQNPRLAWHLPVLVRPEQVAPVSQAILNLFREKGSREKRNRARFRFLIEEIGVSGVLDYLQENLPFQLQPCIHEPTPTSQYDELIGWFRQRDPKFWTMGLSVPLGRMTWRQLEGLALLSKKWGDGTLRTTHEQGIAVANIPTGFKDAAATDAAALGLSIYADPLARNTMACTGSQFCNIAVTETKGHMFQLIEKLRQRTLTLHGIRIHMSGCPSSCAQHFTADIGLKGVRVRRLIGTREGFDVYLGGGIAGRVHMALPYKKGVDVDQLPQLIEEVTEEYYLKHKPGQTFSTYWREILQDQEAAKVGDDDYILPTWICEGCDYKHIAEDPPVFCPSCAGLRRLFARIEDEETAEELTTEETPSIPSRDDGFVYVAKESQLSDEEAFVAEVAGTELAVYRINGKIHAINNACPHEGAQLSDGEVADGVVTCPWHGWTFNACSGCSIEPAGNDVKSHETLVESGNVFVKLPDGTPEDQTTQQKIEKSSTSNAPTLQIAQKSITRPVTATLEVLDVIQETPDVKTFRLDNSAGTLPFCYPGQFAKVCVPIDDKETWRSFTISSSPTNSNLLDLTIKRNPAGEVSNYLFDSMEPGSSLKLKASMGGFFFDPEKQTEPLVLISAGSGITPMMSIARFLKATTSSQPCTFLHGARSSADIIFYEECLSLSEELDNFRYVVSLSQPPENWTGSTGRLSFDTVSPHLTDIENSRYFLCGPNEFMQTIRESLLEFNVPSEKIHSEQFHSVQCTGVS